MLNTSVNIAETTNSC